MNKCALVEIGLGVNASAFGGCLVKDDAFMVRIYQKTIMES